MKNQKIIFTLISLIIMLSAIASITGIFSSDGFKSFTFESIHGEETIVYGKGLYGYMPEDVAVQGIAQDYVTLFVGIPLLIIGMYFSSKGSFKGRFILTGTIGYFFVTYLFYMLMAMYNEYFLIFVSLAGLSFYAFIIMLLSFELNNIRCLFKSATPVKLPGIFLVINGFNIAFLWLSIVVPPLLDGTIYPSGLGYFTTLVVQGLDLSLLLPMSIIIGVLLIKKNSYGYLFGPIYLVFLSILMAALVAKIIAIGLTGGTIFPAVIIIPLTMIIAVYSAYSLINNLKS
jgi:hypothetical protein